MGFSLNRSIVITTLAIYQTRFWAEVASQLKKMGTDVFFISFDDRSTEYLVGRDFTVFSFSESDHRSALTALKDLDYYLSLFSIDNLNYWISHERLSFDLRDTRDITIKFLTYLFFSDRVLSELSKNTHPVLVQELGGFISVIACFFSARKSLIDNFFVEPSFFRGRQFFIKNRFSAVKIPQSQMVEASCEVKEYLSQVEANKTIVMPIKDKHHYSTALAKIFNWHNVRRLFEKGFDQYILGKHQEFGYLKSYIFRHVEMLSNSMKLKGSYVDISSVERFVYFPFHVPSDMALTLRSPHYLDQLSLIDYLVRGLPIGHKLAIKEHPAMIGGIDASRLKKLLRRYDQLVLINPLENNFNVIGRCDAVVSINSKSGAEAILLGKPVLVLGDAFYRDSPLATPLSSITEFSSKLDKCLAEEIIPARVEIERYFERVWRCTRPGELYVCGKHNTEVFAKSLISALNVS